MQIFYYFCTVKRSFLLIGFMYFALFVSAEESPNSQLSTFNVQRSTFNLDDSILDIYNAVTEVGEADFEQIQTDLYALHEHPINLNNTSDEELQQLYFLSPHQIDDILLYADKHPFESLYELRMIPSLEDYEIRDLLPFVRVGASAQNNKVYAHEVFRYAKHEIITRIDARKIEDFEGTDPMFVQTRYRFDYQRRVIFGGQLRRPAGGGAADLQYGMYLQLSDFGHLHRLVAGNFQASFGQGLVFAPVFHSGKSMYVQSVGQPREGLRYYSSADGAGLHGVGATFRHAWDKQTRLDISALYSLKRSNDSIWQHVIGANMTLHYKQLEVQLTAVEKIWSDSIHPYNNARYNRHYFRGNNQAVVGASARYNYGWFDLFGEFAASQNYQRFEETSNSQTLKPSNKINSPHWGFGILAGSRFYPVNGVSLIALYRYYSPFFDNDLGDGFSETSRINDEHGGYLGIELTRWKNWKLSGYGDVFYFSGYKYGLGDRTGTIGYDAMAEAQYIRESWRIAARLRARKKGDVSTYSARCQFDWASGGWSLRTTADANYVANYGISIAQDIAYSFSSVPLSLRGRVQFFDAREWANRIYLYEHDVLYAFSIPATYGLGGRMYVCLRWQIIDQLALYLRLSETLRTEPLSRTDVHLLLRAKL